MVSVGMVAMKSMQSQATDTDPLPRRCRTWLALTGLTDHQFRSVLAKDRPPDPTGCWAPLGTAAARPAAVGTDPLAHQPDHPGTGRLARHQPIHPGPDHRPPNTGAGCRAAPTPDCSTHPWIIDATLIPVHDQSITAISKNYRRSVNTQILINANNHRVIAVGPCWPGNRNDVVVARRTVAHLLDGTWPILGDGRYRGIDTITSPRRATDSPDHPRRPLPQTPAYPRPRRTRHRPAQRLANPAAMPTTRPSHQPQPPHRRRTLEPQEPGTITGQLFGWARAPQVTTANRLTHGS